MTEAGLRRNVRSATPHTTNVAQVATASSAVPSLGAIVAPTQALQDRREVLFLDTRDPYDRSALTLKTTVRMSPLP